VIVVAACAAILGDNIGYWIGRHYGRAVLESPRWPLHKQRADLIGAAEPFFAKHGPKAVFLGRWIAWLRICAAWMAGISGMRWPVFTVYNALGGIGWATTVGLLAYALGHSATTILSTVGIVGAVLAVLAVLSLWGLKRRREREAERQTAGRP
jgi:membrane-associated protein